MKHDTGPGEAKDGAPYHTPSNANIAIAELAFGAILLEGADQSPDIFEYSMEQRNLMRAAFASIDAA